jgi:hypothetical protein
MEIGRLSSLGGELDKRQHVGAMSGSFAPLPDGDPNFLCRSVAHSIQQNWSLGVDRCTRPNPRIADPISAARRAVRRPNFGAGDVFHGH